MNLRNFDGKSPVLRAAGLVIAGTLAALTLGGCAANDAATPTAPDVGTTAAPGIDAPTADLDALNQDAALVDGITVTGPLGSEPTVTFETPMEVSFLTPRLVDDGAGEALHEGQLVTVDAAMWRADTGEQLVSTWADNYPESFIMGGNQFGVLAGLLEGAHVGARALIANPATLPTGENATVITLFEVVGTVDLPTRAEGTAVTYDADAVGVLVNLASNGDPEIEIADGFVPSDELVVQTLIEGTGPVVTVDQLLVVNYTGWLVDGQEFDSSWARNEPAIFPLQGVIPGWTQGLAGQHVGSQVLLIIPPSLGYGDQAAGSIPPNSTLIFVVDILHAESTFGG